MSGNYADARWPAHVWPLLFSLLFHGAIVIGYRQFHVPDERLVPRPVSSQTLYVQLLAPERASVRVIPDMPADNDQAPGSHTEAIAISPVEDTLVSSVEIENVDIPEPPLTEPDDVRVDYHHWRPPPEGGGIHQGGAPDSRPFGQVFNPNLRQRLQNNVMHRSSSMRDPLSEAPDIHGYRYINTPGGTCMRSRESLRPGDVSNWEFVHCHGPDEGDRMLRRVEQQWRRRD